MADSDLSPPRRTRTDTRAARKARRAQAPVAPAFITRQLPPYAPLAEEELLAIEAHADQLLEEIGMEIRGDAAALALWQGAGARISEGCRVQVPKGLAREIVRRSAPSQFTQHARNPARSVQIGGAHTVFAPAYGPPSSVTWSADAATARSRTSRTSSSSRIWPRGCTTPAARCASRSTCR